MNPLPTPLNIITILIARANMSEIQEWNFSYTLFQCLIFCLVVYNLITLPNSDSAPSHNLTNHL